MLSETGEDDMFRNDFAQLKSMCVKREASFFYERVVDKRQ